VREARAVQRAEALSELGAVLLERDAAALPEVGDDLGERQRHAGEEPRDGRGVRRVRLVDEHGRVVRGQREAAGVAGSRCILDGEEAGGGLLLEPLEGVARCDAGRAREAVRGHRPVLAQGAVEPEATAELHGEERRGRREHADELLGEGADEGGLLLLGRGGDREAVDAVDVVDVDDEGGDTCVRGDS